MKRVAAIALGANLPSRSGSEFGAGLEANLREAVERVRSLGEARAVSSFYDTAPVGFTEQPRFLNGALLLETELGPVELMRGLLAIERAMGRDRAAAVAKGPRVIDLDLLLVDGIVLATSELTLPHPAMAERRFVLDPLAEIAPGMADPVSGRTVREMLERLAGRLQAPLPPLKNWWLELDETALVRGNSLQNLHGKWLMGIFFKPLGLWASFCLLKTGLLVS